MTSRTRPEKSRRRVARKTQSKNKRASNARKSRTQAASEAAQRLIEASPPHCHGASCSVREISTASVAEKRSRGRSIKKKMYQNRTDRHPIETPSPPRERAETRKRRVASEKPKNVSSVKEKRVKKKTDKTTNADKKTSKSRASRKKRTTKS